jgi:hypothetical protein
MTWLRERKYLALLIALLLLLAVFPLLHELLGMRLFFDVFITAVFLASLQLLFTTRALRLPAVALGVPTVVGLWANYALPDVPRLPVSVGFHLCGAAFLALTVATILRSAHEDTTVSANSVYGAFCGYLLVGLLFAHLYCAIEALQPGSFRHGEAAAFANDGRRHFLLVYFSLSTLTTVGYGDVAPRSDAARGFAMVEAVCGQFYLAVLLAELIGKRVAGAISEQEEAARRRG